MNLIVHNSRPNNQTVSQTSVILRRVVSTLGSLTLGALCLAILPATQASAQTLTFTGQVYSPLGPPVTGSNAAHGDPIPNILVFVQDPNSPIPVFSQGVTVPTGTQTGCDAQPSLVPATVLGSNLTDYTGTFTFNVAGALPPTVTVVIQAGKWRRQYQYTTAQLAGFTTGTQVTLPTMSMPANSSQGDLPHIAVVTGSADQIECIFPQIGISTSEITDPLGGGSINFFSGNGASGEIVSSTSPTETQLVNPNASGAIPLTNYDMLIFGCQGHAGETDADAVAYAENVVKYANYGGRVFATHWEYSWIQDATEWAQLASWSSSTSTSSTTTTGQLSTAYAGEPVLAAWMNYIGSLNVNPTLLEFTLTSVFYENVLAVNLPAQTWVTLPNYSNSPNQFSFDTPVGATGIPTAVLNFTNNQATYLIGDPGDSVVINVTNNSATPTGSGLTLSLSIPSTIVPVSLADSTGGAWQCNFTANVGTCTLPTPLLPGASDAVKLTFSIPLNATLGPTTLVAALLNGGLNQSQQCGRVLYNDYHVENSGSKVTFSNGAHCTNVTTLSAAQKFLEYSLYNLSNFIAPTTTDTIDIQSPSTTQITNLISPIFYGQTIGDVNGQNAIVSTTAPGGPDNGSLLVYVDTTLACTLLNSGAGGMCPDLLFQGYNAGNHIVYAKYTGDIDYAPSPSPNYPVVIQPDNTTTVVATSLTPAVLGNPITFTATVAAPYATPVGTVSFFADGVPLGTSTIGVAGVATYTTSILTVGTHAITATYASSLNSSGTLNFNPSASTAITQVVTYPPATTVTTLVSSVNPSYLGQNVTFTATVTATSTLPAAMAGTVTFYDGAASLGSVAITTTGASATYGISSLVTNVLTVGTHSITAVFTPATPFPTTTTSTSSPLSQVVNPNVFTMAVDPTNLNLTIGSTISLTITITDVGAFNEPVALGCTGVNTETACSFAQLIVPAGGGITHVLVTPNAPHPCVATAGAAAGTSRLGYLGLTLAAFALFLARKRRNLFRGLSLAAALCLLPLLNGCGTSGCTDFGDKPGTYTFTLTATSPAPNAETLTQTITMVVKP